MADRPEHGGRATQKALAQIARKKGRAVAQAGKMVGTKAGVRLTRPLSNELDFAGKALERVKRMEQRVAEAQKLNVPAGKKGQARDLMARVKADMSEARRAVAGHMKAVRAASDSPRASGAIMKGIAEARAVSRAALRKIATIGKAIGGLGLKSGSKALSGVGMIPQKMRREALKGRKRRAQEKGAT